MGHAVTHAPLEHTWPAPHAVPQAPQLAASSLRRTQVLPQRVVPEGQLHVPLLQVPPLPHTLPQAPQLLGSTCVKVHASPHWVCPVKHALRQPKPVHT